MKHQLRRGDLLWLLAYPIYQLIGSLRHEASHAIAALLLGGVVEEFVFWPTWSDSGFRWGYVVWFGRGTLITTAAPYVYDIVTFVAFFFICTRVRFRRHWVWVNLVIMGLISPFLNSAYCYVRGFMGVGDVARLLQGLPDPLVHVYFAVTLVIYVYGLFLVLKAKTTARPHASD